MILYKLIVWFYNFLLKVSSPFNRKARLIIRGRKQSFRIIRDLRGPDDRVIWFHCASLGEFEQGRPVMESLKNGNPEFKIFVSFFSSSGYEVKKNDPLIDGAFYLPTDTRRKARKLITELAPQIAIFIKYEYWYHFFAACHRYNIPVVSISTILRPEQVFFRSYGKFYRQVLQLVDVYFVQNEETRELLQGIGINNVKITGDTRFDRVMKISAEHKPLPLIEEFLNGKPLVILGSTWRPDIDLWNNFMYANSNKYKFLIAPHHIDETELRYIEEQVLLRSVRYSRAEGSSVRKAEVMIIDCIGLLSSIYYYGYVNYVGGSFSEGLHNILEPAVYGVPILIGRADSNQKYQEAVDLTAMGGVFEINNPDELERIMQVLSGDEHMYWETGDKTKKYVESNLGATRKIVSEIRELLRRENGRTGI